MKINQIVERALKVYELNKKAPVALFLVGAPGVGKTAITRRIAAKIAQAEGKRVIDYEDVAMGRVAVDELKNAVIYVYVNLNLHDPVDISGKPVNKEIRGLGEVMSYSPPLWLKICSEYQCVIVLDELNTAVLDANLTLAMSLINERRSGDVRLSPETFIIATGNRRDENYLVRDLPMPLWNRLITVAVENDINDWIEYMNRRHGDNWNKAVGALLMERRDLFVKPAADGPFPSPRSWEKVAIITAGLKELGPEEIEIVSGAVGGEAAGALATFMAHHDKIEEILKTGEVPDNMGVSEKYYLASVIAVKYNELETAEKIMSQLDDETITLIFYLASDKMKLMRWCRDKKIKTKAGKDVLAVLMRAYNTKTSVLN